MSRLVFCTDALDWLKSQDIVPGRSFVASLPDYSEFPRFSLDQWQEWFMATATLIMEKCPENGVTIFFQSDIKYEGKWIDKAYLIQKAAEKSAQHLLWHKIACRAPAGVTTFGRPSYSHILCFSRGLVLDVSKSTPDVLPELGDKSWQRGMGLEVCKTIVKFLLNHTDTQELVNPFCGEGGMLAVAENSGFKVIGIEKSPKRAEKARHIQWQNNIFNKNDN
jgi:hypothetical protein